MIVPIFHAFLVIILWIRWTRCLHAQNTTYEIIDWFGQLPWFWMQHRCAGGVVLTSCSSTCLCALAHVSYISFMVLSFPSPCSFPWHALALSPHIPFLLTLSLPVCWPHPFIPINILCSLLLCFHRDGSLSFWEQDTESPKDLLHYYFPLLFHPSLHQYLSPRSLFFILLPFLRLSLLCPSPLILSFFHLLFSLSMDWFLFIQEHSKIRRYCIMAKTGKAPFCPWHLINGNPLSCCL